MFLKNVKTSHEKCFRKQVELHFRGAFRTLPKTCDEYFFVETINDFSFKLLTIFVKKLHFRCFIEF